MKASPRVAPCVVVAAALLAFGVPAMAATIRVNTPAAVDPERCTITSAIRAAESDAPIAGCAAGSGADVIKIPAGLYTILEPSELDFLGNSTAFPYIGSEMTIEGEGNAPGDTIIERHPGSFFTFRFFTIHAHHFTIRNLTLSGGRITDAQGGGAILARTFDTRLPLPAGQPRVVIDIQNVRFTNNAGASGGAVADTGFFFGPFVEFNITGSTFLSNRATNYGGGVFASPGSALNLRGSHFEDNDGGEWGGGVATLNGADAPFDISDTTFLNNTAVQGGGAVYSTSPIVTRVTFDGNSVRDRGGAVYSYGGRPQIADSTFVRNSARRGGAIEIQTGSIAIHRSTFAENVATHFEAGALFLDDRQRTSRITNSTFSGNLSSSNGAITVQSGMLTISYSTIAFNTNTAGGWSAGVTSTFNGSNEVVLANTIVSGNTSDGVPLDVYFNPESGDRFVSHGHNLIGSNQYAAGVFTQPGDLAGTMTSPLAAGLQPLAENGGSTVTHALSAASLALDAASSTCEAIDQRGKPRPGPGSVACDIGAYEHGTYYALQLTVNGSGSVTGLPGTPSCTGACAADLGAGTVVTLGAQPAPGFALVTWGGACADASPTCVVTMNDAQTVTATFATAGGDTTTTLISSPNPSALDEAVVFTATVTPIPGALGRPTGQLRFLDTTTPAIIGTATLDATGTAALTISSLPQGQRVIQAIYDGDDLFGGSTSTPLPHQVGVIPNVAPSFSIPELAPEVTRSAGPQTVIGFATAILAGPLHEHGQLLAGFTVVRVSEIGDLQFEVPPAIALDGTLRYHAKDRTSGVATFSVTLRDDGGTAHGGEDTSAPRTFTIVVLGPPLRELIVTEQIGVADTVVPRPSRWLRITEAVGVSDAVKPLPARLLRIAENVFVSDGIGTMIFNTATGSDVTVSPAAGVTVTFAGITRPGMTTAQPASVPPAPTGFEATVPPVEFEVETTAQFTGPVRVCLAVPPGAIAPELFHFESGEWTKRTTTVSSSGVCGAVSSLSPFAAFVPEPIAGRISGSGTIDAEQLQRFDMQLIEQRVGRERGRIAFERKSARVAKAPQRVDRFTSTTIDRLRFFDDPGFRPGRRPKPMADWAFAAGSGTFNGVPGYTYELTATDRGEPGHGRDSFDLVVRDSAGAVVLSASGVLTTGKIQSLRLRP